MTTTTRSFDSFISGAADRPGLLRLLEALGFSIGPEPIPSGALPAWGLGDAPELREALVAGTAGSLDALLLELGTEPTPERVVRLAGGVRRRNEARLHLFLVAGPAYRSVVLGTFTADGGFRHLTLERNAVRASDVDALEEMAARPGEEGLALALRQARALDRRRVTGRFFRDFRAHRSAVAAAWSGVPEDAGKERRQLALLFLCRLTFLYFIQRRGALAGDDRYMGALLGRWLAGPARPLTFFRASLQPLFFGALNRRPADRDAAARALGALPYLNGGLFEQHPLERRFPDLDLPDVAARGVIEGLLERYRFTAREAGEGAGFGVDPEILGRVFEGLMAPDERGDTGSFYTPAPVVNRVVREAVSEYLAGRCGGEVASATVDGRGATLPPEDRRRVRGALERVRVLDPACGSGAFLLGALWRLADALGAVSEQPSGAVRRQIVGGSLHGVDLLDDAALLCSLRLWLALSVDDDEVRPLPNLDRRIRQGDALIDPLDLGALPGAGPGAGFHPLRDPELRRALRTVEPTARRYLESGPEHRQELRRDLAESERRLASRWVAAAHRAARLRVQHLEALAGDRDLFGEVPEQARRARAGIPDAQARVRELEQVARAVDEKGTLPFFSFGVHFAEAAAGFDLIISNPPWVRSHRWPGRMRELAGVRYEVCRSRGWRAGTRLAGVPPGVGAQVDLSLLFLERATRLLAPAGVLAMLIPAKSLRALYGAGGRRMLLRDLEIVSVEDHALDQRSIFRADAFAAVIIVRRPGPGSAAESSTEPPREERPVRVRLSRRGVEPLRFQVRQRDLPLFPGDTESPWILAPPGVVRGIRLMQRAGRPLGARDELRVRRGIMTGANDVLVLRSAEPGLGGICRIEAEGARRARRAGRGAAAARRFRAHVETSAIRPLVRGAGIDAFAYRTDSYVVWCRDDGGDHAPAPPRLQRYLRRHRKVLEGRSGWRPGLPLGAVFRISPVTLGHKVAWHDLSDTLRAVALPPTVRLDGADRELIPLNTVYFLPVPDGEAALMVAGLLNSLPVRVMARAIAERAKDARFRFFAWVLSCLPLPEEWERRPAAAELLRISRRAHAAGGISPSDASELDRAAGVLYGLDGEALDAMAGFDAWLKGDG